MQFQSIGIALFLLAALAAIIRCTYFTRWALRAERRQRALLNLTLRISSDGVITTDGDGRITGINLEAQRITGWTEKTAMNRLIDEVLRIIDAETLAPAASPLQRARAEQVTMMHDGRVIVEGTPAEIRANHLVHDLYLGSAHYADE